MMVPTERLLNEETERQIWEKKVGKVERLGPFRPLVSAILIEKIPVLASDLLEEYPRKVYFFPETGKVLVRKIKSLHNSTILDRETEYRKKIREAKPSGEIDLF